MSRSSAININKETQRAPRPSHTVRPTLGPDTRMRSDGLRPSRERAVTNPVAFVLFFAALGAAGCSSETKATNLVDPGLPPDGRIPGDSTPDSASSAGIDGSIQGSLDGSRQDDGAGSDLDTGMSDTRNDSAASTGPAAQPDAGAGCGSPYGPNLCSMFNGTSLAGWTEVVNGKVTNNNWTVVDDGPGSPVMHSSGANRNFIYYNVNKYGDFRFIFTVKLISDDADSTPHVPCVLFWGSSTTADAMNALQLQPPKGYTWDYRKNSTNTGGALGTKAVKGYPGADTSWAQCEMLANVAAGTTRMACCPSNGEAKCASTPAVEIVDFTVDDAEPNVIAQMPYYLALQAHTGNSGAKTGQIEEFKDLYVESPVVNPTTFVTTQ
jgi:hypothetical protein